MRLSNDERRTLSTSLAPYLADDSVRRMDDYIQHGKVTTLTHCLNVAKTALWLGNRLHVSLDTESLCVGALLHDFFLYDWHGAGWRHSYRHAERARHNAVVHFGVNERIQHVIRCHMWPLGITHVPRTREAVLVSVADKWVSLQETLFKRQGGRHSCG